MTTCEVLSGLPQRPCPARRTARPLPLCLGGRLPAFIGIDVASGRPSPDTTSHGVHPDDIDKLESDPLSVRSRAYDLVLNGWELGSGSIRCRRPRLRRRIFGLLGITPEEADQALGFFLSPFRYGAPPHGSFEFGIDRLVAILAGGQFREVIAFPQAAVGDRP